ncbi:MAG TPA: FG-GAP-like repeat-containing protein [Thermoanaerobaculia bacterium]|nr:FG-GAP-like repeat-containing protein [Thermoanaerobaculia bacterium]
MKSKRFLATSFLIVLLSAAQAWAGHVVWVDFSDFDLGAWNSVNGNNPPTNADLSAIRRQIIAEMSEDYATFDLRITTSKPANGRYTWIKILDESAGGTLGCAGPSCCQQGDCTDIGSWDGMTESALEVYTGTFANQPEFMNANATTARISNGISGTASHELGHILGLLHCNAANDSFEVGCDENVTPIVTDDQNPRWHIMASGDSWELSVEERASRDRFFSPHSERRVLASALQLRNHFAPLANLDETEKPKADLTYGRLASPNTVQWFGRMSSGDAFGNFSEWSGDAGDAGDIFLTGDVDEDGRADLVYGRVKSPTQVIWYVRLSNGNGFGKYSVWSADAGDAGDIFRLADVDGDGKADLVYGRAINPGTVRWYVRKSDGNSFGSYSIFASDAGDVGDLFFVANVDKDKKADLVYARAIGETQVKWFVRRSDAATFGPLETWNEDAGDPGDLMYVGDANMDGKADLVYGHVSSSLNVTWYFRGSDGSAFGFPLTFANDAGDAGDLFRLGDTTGDGMVDLMYGRPSGLVSLTATPNHAAVRWYGRSSMAAAFSTVSTWASDAGDEGDCFP